MPAPDSARKLVSLATIGIVIGVSAWLRPAPDPVFPLQPLPSRSILWVRSGSESVPTPLRPRSEGGRTRVGAGSEYEYAATQVAGTSEVQELRTAAVVVADEPLAARTLTLPLDAIPNLAIAQPDPSTHNPVARAVIAASQQTGGAFRIGAAETAGAFRTAGRALRSIF